MHTDRAAARSVAAIDARAYTVGDHIVLGPDGAKPHVLAHEMAHVVQQRGASRPWVQRQSAAAHTLPAARQDFVFIMGADAARTNNPFYTLATRYFRAHLPGATFVQDQRSLADLLNWISTHVPDPIGNLYIVSHGNEDGTLSFGLSSSASGGHMTVVDLRKALHPTGGGPGTLKSVSSVVDAQTKIHIKGCDIGRTQEMVELIDEAFGGAGVVTAPTHEQAYSTDPTLGARARTAAHNEKIAKFTAGLPALPAEPAKIDPTLKGDARKQAKQEHDAAVTARRAAQLARSKAIASEEARITPGLNATAELAGTVDSLSGPMFQRPGTQLFTAAEIKTQIDRLYGHLSPARRTQLAQRLAAPDRGRPGDQHGQKVIRVTPFSQSFVESTSLAEARVSYGKQFKDNHFQPTGMTTNRTSGAAGTDVNLTFTGKAHPPGADASDTTFTVTESIPDDADILTQGQEHTNNPNRYAWRVKRVHAKSGTTTLTAVGERVMAYLHHESLDAGPHQHFGASEGDADFYATSSFTPPPPPSPPAGSGSTTP